MKVGTLPESILEWLALELEVAPRAIIDTHATLLRRSRSLNCLGLRPFSTHCGHKLVC
jgi:hypothetical protein